GAAVLAADVETNIAWHARQGREIPKDFAIHVEEYDCAPRVPVHGGEELRRLGHRVGFPSAGQLGYLDNIVRYAHEIEVTDQEVGPRTVVTGVVRTHDPRHRLGMRLLAVEDLSQGLLQVAHDVAVPKRLPTNVFIMPCCCSDA